MKQRRTWLLPFAFRPRFFIAILTGLLFLIPAWRFPGLFFLMFVWDALLAILWIIEMLRLPDVRQITAARRWSRSPVLAAETQVLLDICNHSALTLNLQLVDKTPSSLRNEPPSFRLALKPAQQAGLQYTVRPRHRGNTTVGPLYVRYSSRLGLAERWKVLLAEETVCVFPELLPSSDQALYMMRSREVHARARQRRDPGRGRVFESLREYREGDELRDISWSATARRRQVISRNYAAERNQTIWTVIDAGRLMRAEVIVPGLPVTLSKLDLAINAAVAISQIAMQHGDRVGLLAYGSTVLKSVAPAPGPLQTRRFLDALAHVKVAPGEANHARAVRTLLSTQTRRSLILWLTDFAETPVTPDVITYAAHLAKRHLILFAAISQPDLRDLATKIPDTEAEMFQHAAALEIVQRRQTLLASLRRAGVLVLELTPGKVSTALVNQYLEIKDRSLL